MTVIAGTRELSVDGFSHPFRVHSREERPICRCPGKRPKVTLSWLDGAVVGEGVDVDEAELAFVAAAQRRLVVLRVSRELGSPLSERQLRILCELENQVGVARGAA